MFESQILLVPARTWLILAWAWLVWPAVLILYPRRSIGVAVPVAIGLLLLTPCAPTIFVFTAWSTRGFAP